MRREREPNYNGGKGDDRLTDNDVKRAGKGRIYIITSIVSSSKLETSSASSAVSRTYIYIYIHAQRRIITTYLCSIINRVHVEFQSSPIKEYFFLKRFTI